MLPGVYTKISNADYHGGPGESKSLLDLVRRSPAHYRARKIAANDNEPQHTPTPAQMIGTAFHALLLEPHEFVKDYCLALRPQDVPEAIDSKDELVALVAELNVGRKPKLSTSGTKDELVARINELEAILPDGLKTPSLETMKLADLKAVLSAENETRQGLLSDKGTMAELALTLRDAGRPVTLWADVKAEWIANNGQRIVLTQDQWDQLHRMRDAVMAHPAANALMTNVPGFAERSVYWNDPVTGLLCRCRPDWWRQDGIVVDVKTTEDASLEGFARSIANWRYHVQAPFYLDGIAHMQDQVSITDNLRGQYPEAFVKPRAFIFLAVEKSARVVDDVALGVAVYALDKDSLELGRIEGRQDIERIAECTRTGIWPGYSDRIERIALPQWKLKQGEHLLADAA